MKSYLCADLSLDEEFCTLSLALTKAEDHAYIIVESMNEQKQVRVTEAHLNVQEDGTHACIHIEEECIKKLIDIADQKQNRINSWSITHKQKDDLLKAIRGEQALCQEHKIPYVKVGKRPTADFFHAGIDGLGSKASRKFLAQKNHDSLLGWGSAADSLHDSLDAFLRNGDNCASWAKRHVKTILGEHYKETPWEKMTSLIVINPSVLVKSNSRWPCSIS